MPLSALSALSVSLAGVGAPLRRGGLLVAFHPPVLVDEVVIKDGVDVLPRVLGAPSVGRIYAVAALA